MSDDPKAQKRLELLRGIYEEAQREADAARRVYVIELNKSSTVPPSLRFANLAMNDAILKYLVEEAPDGANREQIREALIAGGRAINKPTFERDLKNALGTKMSRSLIRHGDLYVPSGKKPSHRVDRHRRDREE